MSYFGPSFSRLTFSELIPLQLWQEIGSLVSDLRLIDRYCRKSTCMILKRSPLACLNFIQPTSLISCFSIYSVINSIRILIRFANLIRVVWLRTSTAGLSHRSVQILNVVVVIACVTFELIANRFDSHQFMTCNFTCVRLFVSFCLILSEGTSSTQMYQ